jgi:hypothetical protein|tara:strand:+ start:90 stop:386 length:297 start_codon:yes stop_codon:yes gene_type:complete
MKKFLTIIAASGLLASCSVTTPVTATNNRIGAKVGVATATCLFGSPLPGSLSSGLVLGGPYTIADAAKNGGITKIATVDVKKQNFLLFTKNSIIVTGE